MRHIDEDTITQAVIARHAGAGDARLREVMTCLVQHLHAFARESKLTEAEWAAGLDFLAECARMDAQGRRELTLLSDTLGLSTLVAALQRRRAQGGTESAMPTADREGPADPSDASAAPVNSPAPAGPPCFVRGHVRTLTGQPVADAEIRVTPSGVVDALAAGAGSPMAAGTACGVSDAHGAFVVRCTVPQTQAIPSGGPVGRLLGALGRHPWRPAFLAFNVRAPGHAQLVTQVFRQGGDYLDTDALFGVRSSLVADWVPHPPGPTPDGGHSDVGFCVLDFDFVLPRPPAKP